MVFSIKIKLLWLLFKKFIIHNVQLFIYKSTIWMIQTLRTKEAVIPNRLDWNGVNAFTISDKFEDNYAIGFEYTFLAYFCM